MDVNVEVVFSYAIAMFTCSNKGVQAQCHHFSYGGGCQDVSALSTITGGFPATTRLSTVDTIAGLGAKGRLSTGGVEFSVPCNGRCCGTPAATTDASVCH